MNFIKKIFDDSIDESVHLQFQKFSKGDFRDRALIKAKQSKGKYSIITTAEFANNMVEETAKKLGSNKTQVTGAIISTIDLTGKLDFQNKKQFMGIKKYLIDKEMSGNEILELLDRFPNTFFGLSFDAEGSSLKIKPKAPKSAKSNSKGKGKPKINFCKLVTDDANLGRSFVFEKPNFKKAEISHDFIVEELILPEGEKDYNKIRELAKRKGKVIRKADIDEGQIFKEVEFIA